MSLGSGPVQAAAMPGPPPSRPPPRRRPSSKGRHARRRQRGKRRARAGGGRDDIQGGGGEHTSKQSESKGRGPGVYAERASDAASERASRLGGLPVGTRRRLGPSHTTGTCSRVPAPRACQPPRASRPPRARRGGQEMPAGMVSMEAVCLRSPLSTVTCPCSSTSMMTASPSAMSPASIRSASASSSRRMMARRSGRAP